MRKTLFFGLKASSMAAAQGPDLDVESIPRCRKTFGEVTVAVAPAEATSESQFQVKSLAQSFHQVSNSKGT